MQVQFIYDLIDREVIGPNPTLVENFPARFRNATQAEVDAHHRKYGPPLAREGAAPPPVEAVAEIVAAPTPVPAMPKKTPTPAQLARIQKMNAARLAKKAASEKAVQ